MAKWYEKPIKVYPASWGSQSVLNGREGYDGVTAYPERHYWPSEEAQRNDCNELLAMARFERDWAAMEAWIDEGF